VEDVSNLAQKGTAIKRVQVMQKNCPELVHIVIHMSSLVPETKVKKSERKGKTG
jgi:hypothetical protein